MNLLKLAQLFLAKHPEYSTERGASCSCWQASVKFARMCRICGYDARVGSGYMHGSYHAVTLIGTILIDFTARQFKGGYPRIRVAKNERKGGHDLFFIDERYDSMIEPLVDAIDEPRPWEEQY